MPATRVVHIPARTPYARKLRSDQVNTVNETAIGGVVVPRDATLRWLLQHRPWDWFDAVHLHHIDFESVEDLESVIAGCRKGEKRVVFTAHDTDPVFADPESHQVRLKLLADAGVPTVSLTPAARDRLHGGFGVESTVIPHGFVAPPGTGGRRSPRRTGPTRFLLYGSLRANRDVELVLACWRFARDLRNTELRLLLRAPSRASLEEDAAAWRSIREHAVDPRLQIDVLSYPSDGDITEAVAASDCLVLPYRWASHSGQLEHAFDLGVLPVAARIGFLPEQVELHGARVDPPVWCDWSAETPFAHGKHLLDAMARAHAMIQDSWAAPDPDGFARYREAEHETVIAAYHRLYGVSDG
jgi:hypothetical protein